MVVPGTDLTMTPEEAAALKDAAAATRQRIKGQMEEISPAVAKVLAYVAENLTDRQLSVAQMENACLLTKRTRREFRAAFGTGPKRYLMGCKMEMADWLVRHTDLKIWRIGHLLGHRLARNFSQAFRTWWGHKPSVARKEAGRPPARQMAYETWGLRWQGLVGALPRSQGQRWIAELRQRFPPGPRPSVELSGHAAEALAEGLWQVLRQRPADLRLRLVQAIGFSTSTFFHFLGRKSLEEGRRDRQRGVELAKLALASLEGSGALLGEVMIDLEALGWARLGNAQRLALDLDGAEESFRRAEEVWQRPRARRDPVVEAEILSLRATLRLYQRRYQAAREELDRAVKLCRANRCEALLVKCLIERAEIADYFGEHRAAVADLEAALDLLEDRPEPYQELIAQMNLAISYLWVRKPKATVRTLPQARKLCAALDNTLIGFQLDWIEGLARQELGKPEAAERLLRAARYGLIGLGEIDHAAVVALDLAILCEEQGRCREVMSLASEVLPLFQRLHILPEASFALQLLTRAILDAQISREVLLEVRQVLLRLYNDPSSPLTQEEKRGPSLKARPGTSEDRQ